MTSLNMGEVRLEGLKLCDIDPRNPTIDRRPYLLLIEIKLVSVRAAIF